MKEFGEIYSKHFSDVYKYVLSLCRDETIAEEVTQKTFFKAMQPIDKFNGSYKLYVWLCQIAKNTYFTLSKKQKRLTLDIVLRSIQIRPPIWNWIISIKTQRDGYMFFYII